ncbi:spore germination protein GerPE [Alkalihalobacillus sp. AL-G]|uniref:spore germination protein GerPE n=1 Tax=Alkalihalobacillus sp. AL-G TaxID=2926399 RepID=UPI002729C70C|nr:spore germination protein GerPE [Alkalihalobacillus sp. AL-G]WLD91589.1 spore germination protein GerPE [Alkalihalobacillus sp. AL-G]
MERTSIVQKVNIQAVSSSSIFQAGDTRFLTPYAQSLAVQRQASSYDEEEHTFELYPFFKTPFPNIDIEVIPVNKENRDSAIQVNSIQILGVAAASSVRIGKTDCITSQSRVKHIRHFVVNPYE